MAMLLTVAGAQAQTTAKLGDRAAGLDVTFVKGQPIVMGASPQVTVVEFWATWCGPCKQTIPHLSSVQAKYRDTGLQIVGISTEDEETVRPFVADMGDQMNYTVAVDNNYETARGYMAAYAVETIPHAFIVDRTGAVTWHGHPANSEFEGTLVRLLGAGSETTKRDVDPGERALTREELDAILRERAQRASGTPPPPGPRDEATRPKEDSSGLIVINNHGITKPAEEIKGFSFVEKKKTDSPPAGEEQP